VRVEYRDIIFDGAVIHHAEQCGTIELIHDPSEVPHLTIHPTSRSEDGGHRTAQIGAMSAARAFISGYRRFCGSCANIPRKSTEHIVIMSPRLCSSPADWRGEVFRVPAPEVEAVIGRFLRDHCRDQQTDLRSLIEAQMAKIIIKEDSISVELTASASTPTSSAQTARLPWSKKPFRVAKGVVAEPPLQRSLQILTQRPERRS
jgi:hypothetical protein